MVVKWLTEKKGQSSVLVSKKKLNTRGFFKNKKNYRFYILFLFFVIFHVDQNGGAFDDALPFLVYLQVFDVFDRFICAPSQALPRHLDMHAYAVRRITQKSLAVDARNHVVESHSVYHGWGCNGRRSGRFRAFYILFYVYGRIVKSTFAMARA